MGSAGIDLIPLLLCAGAVIALEAAAQWINADPLIVTAAIRLIDICLVLGIIYIFYRRISIIGLSRKTAASGIWHGMLWAGGFGGLVLVVSGILYVFGISPLSLIQIQVPENAGRLILFIIIGGVIGPVAEEFVFRGLFYSFLRRWGLLAALIGSTALFVLAHQPAAGIPVPQIVGGVVFALSYEASKSLITPMIIHVSGNLSLFMLGGIDQLF
ncbi:MAG: CPBP family intramembrane glutamic endopeptidase [Desulfobacterales bacterium]